MTVSASADLAQACALPLPITRSPGFAVPRGACDTHAHVIGGTGRHPFVPDRSYTPPPQTAAAYLGMLNALGMDRGVLVQISVHGTDNRLMVAALQSAPDRLRGVAVVAPDIADAELDRLHAAGVRGVRVNTLFGGGVGLETLEALAGRIARLGWHLQLLVDPQALRGLGGRLRRLPVDLVIDHMGLAKPDAPEDRDWMLGLMEDGRVWAKLSGANRVSRLGAPFHDTLELAQALSETAPDRCLWGSDWPHVALPGPMSDTCDLLDLFAAAVPDPDLRRRILVTNPTTLYGFAPL